MAGLPKKYAKMGFKKGWAAYRRSKGSRKASRTSTPRKVKRMARRRSYGRKRSYSRKAQKIPLLPLAGVATSAYVVGKDIMASSDKADTAMRYLTGYSPVQKNWELAPVLVTYGPTIGGVVAHKIVTRLGVNRALKAIPFLNL